MKKPTNQKSWDYNPNQRKKSFNERFWEKVDVQSDDECWNWLASLNTQGYGRMWTGNRYDSAHRIMYKLQIGEIPEGFFVCHFCDNPKCVNPKHLFLGTASDNMQDMWNKGRHPIQDFWSNYDTSGENQGASKLKDDDILEIRRLYASGDYFQWQLGEMFNVSQNCISNIVRYKTWKNVR